jgi:WD40 repeat protein
VVSVAFSPDGQTLLTGGWDGAARFWDGATGKPLDPPLTHGGTVNSVAFLPDGRSVLTASEDGAARLWDIPAPTAEPADQILAEVELLTGLRLTASGALEALDAQAWAERR